ncbi:MAG TPA: tetratricopeptide repeat protein, partial [Thermoanaerobaculia bacterium]|nr:tetratricopeptide repeat protein [Thermoanaerobaculia bacterium]
MKQSLANALLATFLLAACATTPPTEPGTGLAAQIFEIDPRAGFTSPSGTTAAQASAFEKALGDLAAGRRDRGQQRLAEIERKTPAYAPATLALGALALESGNAALAAPKIEAAAKAQPGWLAAEYYLARLDMERGNLEGAASRLRALASAPGAPAAVAERLAAVETTLFDRFYQAASGAPPAAAIATLRRALALRPESTSARLLLVENLIAARNFTEARMEIDPLLQVAGADSPEVQRALAEIDAGRGRFEESIDRYERIVRTDPRPEYLARLEQIKEQFAI